MSHHIQFRRQSQKDFASVFEELTSRHSAWQAWDDFVHLAAIALACPPMPEGEIRQRRNEAYQVILEKYDHKEIAVFPRLFELLVRALEEEPDQDYLGELFMMLELSSHWHGQFFTPYSICQMMAKMSLRDADERIKRSGWVPINDPACGAGALLIASRNEISRLGAGHLPGELSTLFVGQDISTTAALMCYCQISLLGCAGYVIIGNTLSNPSVGAEGNALLPVQKDGQEYWFTPMWYHPVWEERRRIAIASDYVSKGGEHLG